MDAVDELRLVEGRIEAANEQLARNFGIYQRRGGNVYLRRMKGITDNLEKLKGQHFLLDNYVKKNQNG